MKRYLLAGLLAGASPAFAHPVASPAVIGWSVSPGHSITGSRICTLFGGFSTHSDLAWVADAANPPQRLTLVFDDGGAAPRSQTVASQLYVVAPGSPPLAIPGTIKYGQFRTNLDRRTLENFLYLFVAKPSMTVALEGQSPVLVSLAGSADAAQDMRQCEASQDIVQLPTAHVRVAATAEPHRAARAARKRLAAARAAHRRHLAERITRRRLVAFETPLPNPPPVAPALPAPAPAAAPAAPPAVTAIATPLPAPPPAPVAPALPAPAPAAKPTASAALAAIAPPLPAPPPALVVPVLPAPAPAAAPAAIATPLPAPPLAPAAPALPSSATPAPPVAAATPAAAPPPSAQVALMNDMLLIAKAIEDQFLAILQDDKASYENTSDATLSLAAQANRAADICTLLGSERDAVDWTGTISELSSSGTVLAVKLADNVTVGTSHSPDDDSTSMIDPASDLFNTISQMHVGERVRFSGNFFPSASDCIKETSPTQKRSMTAPYFLMKFTSVAPQQ